MKEHHQSGESSSTTSTMTTPTVQTEHDTNSSPAVTNRVNSNHIHQEIVLHVNDVPVLENQEHVDAVLENNYKDKYFDSLPAGHRFKPQDHELIVYYLARKIANLPLPLNRFWDVELYTKDPATLTAEYKCNGGDQWYFFTPRIRKYPQGGRPNRAAGNGYWKATSADRPIKFNNTKVGYRKSLVFYEGKAPKGDKSQWIMHEYRIENPPKRNRTGSADMKLDDWLLCKVYKKAGKVIKKRDNTEGKHNIDEYPPAQPQPINEIQKQTPMLPVSVPCETTPCTRVSANPLNGEQSIMLPDQPQLLPNHVNQMEYRCHMGYDQRCPNYSQYPNFHGEGREMDVRQVHYQSQQQPFVQAQNGTQDQQIPVNLLMLLQSNLRSENQQLGHVSYDNQQRNVWFGNQHCQMRYDNPLRNVTRRYDDEQRNVRYENQQSQMRYENRLGNMKYDNQQRNAEYEYLDQRFEECIHPGSYWDIVYPPSDYSSTNYMLSCDNINDNNVDQFFNMDQNDSKQQPPTVSKKDDNF